MNKGSFILYGYRMTVCVLAVLVLFNAGGFAYAFSGECGGTCCSRIDRTAGAVTIHGTGGCCCTGGMTECGIETDGMPSRAFAVVTNPQSVFPPEPGTYTEWKALADHIPLVLIRPPGSHGVSPPGSPPRYLQNATLLI